MPESRFKQPKSRSKKTRVWPTVYENAFYLFKMQDRNENESQIPLGQSPHYHLPISFFLDSLIDINEFTDAGLSKEITEKVAIGSNAKIIDEKIVGERFLDRVEQYIQRAMKERSVTLSNVCNQFSLPQSLARELINLTKFSVQTADPGYVILKVPANLDSSSSQPRKDITSNTSQDIHQVHTQGSGDNSIMQILSAYELPAWIDKKKLTNATVIATVLYDVDTPLTTRQITDVLKRIWKENIELRNISRELTTPGFRLASHLVKNVKPRTYNLSEDGRLWFQSDVAQELS
jgi:hypothetical protein